ncbi:juvenile hormone acid O-methyltransferase-like [Nylanderia fulva]|uniref:juvenile hormone acid O-methyltransferase-like n=1 Tax=Nylanderia fulva TaxID=613905 RepID=UPI0010FB7425|nr:juvenile hormone acid O-methyltransferase-like [Nylanderia fulva]
MSPEEYVSFDDLQQAKVISLIDEFQDDLKRMSGKCMDIGCGPGDITTDILLPTLHPKAVILGTDISKNMIEFANKEYSKEKRLKFEILDAETKSLPKKYISEFDHIFSFNALNWCEDIQQTFQNIYCMLRHGGNILMLIVATHDIYEVMKIMAQDSRFKPYIPNVNKYVSPFNDSAEPRNKLRKLLEKLGFKIHHCSLRETTYSSKNSSNFYLR